MLSELDEMTKADAAHVVTANSHGYAVDPARPLEVEDNWLYYADDGECVGKINGGVTDWRPINEAAVDWALGVKAEIEADLAAVNIRQAAVMDNFAKLRRKQEQRLAWWAWRFQADVVAYVRKSLEGGKSRSRQFENGRVAFRSTAGTNKITDPDAAVHFVEERDPLAIKVTRSVTVKDVLRVAAEHGDTRPTMAHFLHTTGPSEAVAIETGVGK